jgi:hypothetical protein
MTGCLEIAPTLFSLFGPLLGLEDRATRALLVSPQVVCRSFCLRFGVILMKRVKGWRLFHDRGRTGALCPTGGRKLQEREKGTGVPWTMSPRTGDKDRPIDPMSGMEFVRKRSPNRFRALFE